MSKRMLVNAAQEGEVRVATVENSVLEDLNIATDANELLKGNLYKGVVVSVESGLQAAFVDYGSERNGFITFNDIHRRYYNKKTKNDGKRLRIQDAIAPGAELLVQVYKEEVGNKGAALTTDITLPGRYLVLMPFSDSGGVSRKIESESVRKKLKEIVNKLNVPDQMGLIVRTAGQDRTKAELVKDYQSLARGWGHSQARYEQLKGPGLVYREPDVVIRSIRDYFTDDVTEIVVDNDSVMNRLVDYFEQDAPDVIERVKRYRGKMPLFSNYGLEKQLENISSNKVGLPSGGSIVINPTEALTAIDVNSGKSRGQSNQEQMAFETNLEAAEEAARQLRLRDLGGLVVIDFIDMYENKHRRQVEKKLKEAMKRDKARVELGRISRFGLLELSRQRVKARLISSTHTVCPTCEGSGYVMSMEVSSITMLRRLQELAVSAPKDATIRGRLPVPVALNLLNAHRSSIADLESNFQVTIEIVPEIDASSSRDAFEIRTKAMSDRDAEDQKTERRERKERGRNRRRSGRSERPRASEKNVQKSAENDSEETNTQPYEPPRVVGFIEPEKLNDTSPIEEAIEAESTEGSGERSPEPRDRRRRRRRGRRNDGQEKQKNNAIESAATEPSADEQKRQEARERNRARRKARGQTAKPVEQAPLVAERQPTDGETAPARTPEPISASVEARDTEAAKTSRQASSRLRSKIAEKLRQPAASKAQSNQEEVKSVADKKTESPRAKNKKPSGSAARIKEKLLGRGQAQAVDKSEHTESNAPETKVQETKRKTAQTKAAKTEPKTTEKRTPSKSKRVGSGASARAAEVIKAKLADKLKNKDTAANTEANKTSPESEAISAGDDASTEAGTAAAPEEKPTRKRRTTRRKSDSVDASPESSAKKPSRARRSRKATEDAAAAEATPDAKTSADEATEAPKPRRSRARKAATTNSGEGKETASVSDDSSSSEAASTPKPKSTSRTRTTRARKATTATTETAPAETTKKTRTRTRKAATESVAEPADAGQVEEKQTRPASAKKSTRKATTKKASKATDTRSTSGEGASEVQTKPAPTKKRAPRKAATTKTKKTAAEESTDEPKAEPKKQRAKTSRSATKQTSTKAKVEKDVEAASAKPKRTTRKKSAKPAASDDQAIKEKAADVLATLTT
ncbi:MAG: Rne/Rng family ribonuclease [Bradymonadia bacterium]